MTLQQRADAYAAAFPTRPPLQIVTEGKGKTAHDVIYGQFVCGNDYTNKTRYYGAYPHGYLERVMALFPDEVARVGSSCRHRILHAFSGSLPQGGYDRCDVSQDAEWDCSVVELPFLTADHQWQLILADPPYSKEDAKKYNAPMVDRGRATRALAEVCRIGGYLVWLDCCWPMHRKSQWRTVGRIGLTRSTNHRTRMVTIFERVSA